MRYTPCILHLRELFDFSRRQANLLSCVFFVGFHRVQLEPVIFSNMLFNTELFPLLFRLVQSSQSVLDFLMVLRVLRLVKIMGQIKRFVQHSRILNNLLLVIFNVDLLNGASSTPSISRNRKYINNLE